MEFVKYILNLVLVIPIVLLLFFIAIKMGKTSFSKIGMHNHVSVLEKINLSKDSSVLVLKVGEEGCVGVLTSSGFETIQKLNQEELKKLEDKKNQFLSQENGFNFKEKVKFNKKDKEEKEK